MSSYYCYFILYGLERFVKSDAGLHVFKDGFWLDAEYQLTVTGDCVYWIPPSQIRYITKVRS